MSTIGSSSTTKPVRIVVATTVALSFISFWRAGAIILNDLGSSAFYAVGTAEQAFGKSAPWLILAVMLFAYAVRMVYIESCVMFTRGGVYRIVKEGMGPTLAKLGVSALLFDYVLTGPISVVSAGQYITGLVNDTYLHFVHPAGAELSAGPLNVNLWSMVFGIGVTIYFWRKNIIGIHESSQKALRIMYAVTALVVIELAWCGITLAIRGGHLPPLPTAANMQFQETSLGWLWGSSLSKLTLVAVIIAFGHSVLAMSGEESLAQVNREIAHPKLKNLQRTGMLVWVYSMIFTATTAFLAAALIPDNPEVWTKYKDNIISGLAMNVVGPTNLRLIFQAFVVVVGTLMLSGAANTAIVGSNGVMNRLAEDGVLTDWFRRPHPRHGTSYRMINLVVGLQLFTILASRGNVYLLAEAYAFGVIWSFTLMTYSVLMLRFKQPGGREWKVPLNIRIGQNEVPVGLLLIGLTLFVTAVANLFTKKVATVSGAFFTAFLFVVFSVSERVTARRRSQRVGIEQFNLATGEQVTPDLVGVRPGNVLVAVRDPHSLEHLRAVLNRTDTGEQDIVVMTTRLMRGADFAEQLSGEQNYLGEYEQLLYTGVVSMAEKAGRPVHLTVVPATNPEDAIMLTAQRLNSSKVVVGRAYATSALEKARLIGLAWERLPHPRPRLALEVIGPHGESGSFVLGPHTPVIRPEVLELLHRTWLELTQDPAYKNLHHDQLVAVAVRRLAAGLRGAERDDIRTELRQMMLRQAREGRKPST
jgi:amino acid transporter